MGGTKKQNLRTSSTRPLQWLEENLWLFSTDAHVTHLMFTGGKRGVASDQEMQVRRGDEGGDHAQQIVVHVGRVTQSGRAR